MFRSYIFLSLLTLFGSTAIYCQSTADLAKGVTSLGTIPMLQMPTLDNNLLQTAEADRIGPGIAPRFAENIAVSISPETDGLWETTKYGEMVWRLRIKSAGAYSINLGFSQYEMPAGGRLMLYDPEYKNIKGPFTPADNEEHEQLWTPILDGDEIIIEVTIPADAQPDLKLHLSYVNHAFLDFNAAVSGSCNLDVICTAEDGWGIIDEYRDIIQSVAVISLGGGTFCTGFLVNNVQQDCTPFFMTANHCGVTNGNAASLVTYWNFVNSFCRQPNSAASGQPGDGLLNDFNSGATFRAGSSNSDFTLVELDDPVSGTANAFFAGWDARAAAISSAIAVHHPRTDEKRISFEDDPLIFTNGFGNNPSTNFTHVRVADWDVGTTEPGSSGSPLFDQDKRVVGQLHGGGAACGNSSSDWYGAFAESWDAGGTSSTQLKDWLDPNNSGTTVIDGRYANGCDFAVNAAPSSITICPPENAVYDLMVTDAFINNVSLSVTGVPFGATSSFGNNSVSPGGSTSFTISNTGGLSPGTYDIIISGTDGTNDVETTLQLEILSSTPNSPVLDEPFDQATNIAPNPTLIWTGDPNATTYEIEIATDPFFTNIVEIATTSSTDFTPINASQAQTTYYWRVNAINNCSSSGFSNSFEFTTGNVGCQTININAPIEISTNGTPTITSTLTFPDEAEIADLNVQMTITHSYIGDISVSIFSPSGIEVSLIDRPGFPGSNFGCSQNDLHLTLNDEATLSADDLENTCNNAGLYAIEGSYQPIQPLNAFNNQDAMGDWILSITDHANQDGGSLDEWSITVCFIVSLPPPELINNNTLPVPYAESEVITSDYLEVIDENSGADELVFTVTNLPVNGTLLLNGVPLGFGGTFTQEDIYDNNLSYEHDGSVILVDEFTFDIENAGGEMLTDQVFNIEIIVTPLMATLDITQELLCAGGTNAMLEVTSSGGIPPYSFSLNGGNSQSENVFIDLSSGIYSLAVVDQLGENITSNEVEITAPPTLSATVTVTDMDITINASGGTGVYQYSLDGENFQTENTFTGLVNGEYTVTVQDENGCLATVTATISVNTLSVNATVLNHVTCNGLQNGSIMANVSGGAMPYQYSLDGENFQDSNVFTDLAAGEYAITVLDNDGFTAQTSSLTVTQPDVLLASASVDEMDISVAVSGGTTPYQYSLDGENFQAENTFTGLVNGEYTVTVQDENGCLTTTTATVLVNTLSVSGTVLNHVTCFDFQDGSIMADVSGGAMPYQYSLDGENFQDSNVFTGLVAGEYAITVLDNNGFTAQTSSLTVTQPDVLLASASVDEMDISVVVSGGTTPYQYSLDGENFQAENTFTGLVNGEYTVTVQDENGCLTTTVATILVNTLSVSATVLSHVSCNGFQDGSIMANVSGGAIPFQYSLDGENFQNTNIFSNLSVGSYNITILDNDGFTAQTTAVIVTQPDLLSTSASVVDMSITIAASGGTSPYQYNYGGENFQNENTFTGLANGEYTVTTQDANGCTSTTTATVSVTALSVDGTVLSHVSCNGFQDGSIMATGTGGVLPYQYSIDGENFQDSNSFNHLPAGIYTITIMDAGGMSTQTNSINILESTALNASAEATNSTITITGTGGTMPYTYSVNGEDFLNTNVFQDMPNGNYTVVIRDASNCVATADVIVMANTLFSEVFITEEISCFGQSDGSIMAQAQGGMAPYQYSLDGENFQTSNTFSDLAPGEYVVTVEDAVGFLSQTNVIVLTDPLLLNLTLEVNGDTITANSSGGTGEHLYSLDGQNYGNSNVFENLPNDEYTVYVLDENSCVSTEEVTILVNNLVVGIEVMQEINCFEGSDGSILGTASNGNPAYLYSLDGENFQEDPLFSGLAAGSYTITVMDADGFSQISSMIELISPTNIELEVFLSENNISITATGGIPSYMYSLDGVNFQEDPEFTNLADGEFQAWVMDANGCLTMSDELIIINDINEFDNTLEWLLYPNPANDQCFLEIPTTNSSAAQLKLRNVLGQVVLSKDISVEERVSQIILNLSQVPKGSYFVEVYVGNVRGVKKLIIQ